MLSDIIDASPVAPGWVRRRAHWQKIWRLGSILIDSLLEGVNQGRRAGLPNAIDVPGIPGYGGFEDVGSLDKIGRDEGVLRGLTETPPDYAFRLRNAQSADAAGWTAPPLYQLMEQMAQILGPTPPLMRLVNSAGDWWTRYQDGHYELARVAGDGITYHLDGTKSANPITAHAWDWDSATLPAPPDQGFVGRWWLIFYLPIDPPYGTVFPFFTYNSGAIYGCSWNDTHSAAADTSPWVTTYGTNSPLALIERVFSLVAQRHLPGFECSHVIVCSDPTQFAPDGSSTLPGGEVGTAYPDGTWGWASKPDTGTGTRIIARNSTAEYWKTQ